MKTVYEMCKDGWCDDCDASPLECLKLGHCKGYKEEEVERDEKVD